MKHEGANDAAIALGFDDADEMFELISRPDLSASGALEKFAAWKDADGTKTGLLTLFPEIAS